MKITTRQLRQLVKEEIGKNHAPRPPLKVSGTASEIERELETLRDQISSLWKQQHVAANTDKHPDERMRDIMKIGERVSKLLVRQGTLQKELSVVKWRTGT